MQRKRIINAIITYCEIKRTGLDPKLSIQNEQALRINKTIGSIEMIGMFIIKNLVKVIAMLQGENPLTRKGLKFSLV